MIRLHRQRRIEHDNAFMSVTYRDSSLRERLETLAFLDTEEYIPWAVSSKLEIPLINSRTRGQLFESIEDVVQT